jgi:hypothetical protein
MAPCYFTDTLTVCLDVWKRLKREANPVARRQISQIGCYTPWSAHWQIHAVLELVAREAGAAAEHATV